ncbi:hypothetical protein FB33_1307, partial [Cutibacterium acnes]
FLGNFVEWFDFAP